MSFLTRLAAAAIAATAAAGAAPATPPTFDLVTSGDAAVEAASSRFCYPRFGYTYRPGYGLRRIVIGWTCLPLYANPIPRPIGPDPGPLQRIGPVYR